MNERIKELAEQADAFDDAMDVGGKSYIGLRDEYFAKLIVRECAKRVDYWESRQGEHTEDLLKHFGVE
jgi:hypothetical protein